MDTSTTDETSTIVKKTQLLDNNTTQIPVSSDAEQVSQELKKKDYKTLIILIEKNLIRLVSLLLIIHGVISLYEELLNIFFVFPYLSEAIRELGYSDDLFDAIYKRSVIVTSTAAIETIYGLAILSRMDKLVRRLHIFSGSALVIIAMLARIQTTPFEKIDTSNKLPDLPTVANLIQATDTQERIGLFKNLFGRQ